MDLRVNLKVCEGCGCLWYRTQVEIRVYCTACNERFKEFPTSRSRKRRGRPKKMLLPTVFAVQAEAQSTWNSDLEECFSEYAHTKAGHNFSPQTGQFQSGRKLHRPCFPQPPLKSRVPAASPEVSNECSPPTPPGMGRTHGTVTPATGTTRRSDTSHSAELSRNRPAGRSQRSCGRARGLLRLLPQVHRKPAPPIPLRFHAGWPFAIPAGSILGRGWVSSRKIRTFEDALIFVLDVERCLKRLSSVDRQLISRVIIQEYTQSETAAIMGISVRTVCTKLPQAIDRLTEDLVQADLLVLPD